MNSAWKVGAVVLAAVVAVSAVTLAQSRWVRGAVTAIGPDTLTVKVKDQDITFTIDRSTRLVARGAGSAARQAEQGGRPGPTLAEFVKVGQNVEVAYRDSSGKMLATEVRPVAGGEGTSAETSGSSYQGMVTVVTADAVTVKGADNQEWRFGYDPKISVIGTGVGTKARAMREAGKPLAVPELVGAGDTIIVYYVESGTVRSAKEIRVLQRAR